MILDGRIRTHVQTVLGPNRVQNGGVDGIQESIHSVIWTPIYMWNGRVSKATRVTKEGELTWERDRSWSQIGTDIMQNLVLRMSAWEAPKMAPSLSITPGETSCQRRPRGLSSPSS